MCQRRQQMLGCCMRMPSVTKRKPVKPVSNVIWQKGSPSPTLAANGFVQSWPLSNKLIGCLGLPESAPKQHLDIFTRFSTAYERDQQTDRQTDHTTPIYSSRSHLMHLTKTECMYVWLRMCVHKNLNIYIHRRKAGGEIESKSFKLQLESLQSNLLYIQ